MNEIFNAVRRRMGRLVIVSLLMGVSINALAVPPNEVLQFSNFLTLHGACCSSFGVSVQVTEPAKPLPVVITWSPDFQSNGAVLVGLMLNDGACAFYGPASIPFSDRGSRTFQWVLFPTDGLRAGSNTFTVCGGGAFGDATLVLNDLANSTNSLAARLSN